MELAFGKRNAFQRTREPGLRSQFVQTAVLLVAQPACLFQRQHVRHHAAAKAADAKASWLLSGEDDQLDRAARLEPKLLQETNRLKPAEHANATVIHASVEDCIDMRACADRWKIRLAA